MRTTLLVLLLVLAGCQQRKLVISAGGYVDDALAASSGFDYEDLQHGGWHFDGVELVLLVPPNGKVHLIEARVNGQTFGEQIVSVQVRVDNRSGTPLAAELLRMQMIVVAAFAGFTEAELIPEPPSEIDWSGNGLVTQDWRMRRPGDDSIGSRVSATAFGGRDEPWSGAAVSFEVKDLAPYR